MQSKELSAVLSAPHTGTQKLDPARWKVAQEFEALFIHQMLKSMRNTVPESTGDEPSHARTIFTEMLDEEMSTKASQQGGMGLAKQIYAHLDGATRAPSMQKTGLDSYQRQALPPRANAEQVNSWALEAAQAYGIDENLLKGLIAQESAGDSLARSSKGAMGLTQLMPLTAKELGVENPWDGKQNVFGGAKYLKRMMDLFNGDEKLALAAYNAGPGTVSRLGRIPNYRETENYVQKVLNKRDQLRNTEVNHEG